MRPLSPFSGAPEFSFRFRSLLVSLLALIAAPVLLRAQAPEMPSSQLGQQVKEIFRRSAGAVVKIHAVDRHGELSGTGFFVDPAGTLFTAYSVGGDASNFTVEMDGQKLPAKQMLVDLRSGLAILKVDATTPYLPIGHSETLEVATPVVTVGFPLDLPETPSFGMIAGFDHKYLGRYFSTTHLRVNLPTQRGEAGAPLLNFQGEVVGMVVSSLENNSSCYALPINAAEKIRSDYVRFGEPRHGWVGINVAEATEAIDGSRARLTKIMDDTPAADSGLKSGDILLQVGKTKVHDPVDVIDASFYVSAGDTVPIVVNRDGQTLTFNLQAVAHPAALRSSVSAALGQRPQALPLRLQSARDQKSP